MCLQLPAQVVAVDHDSVAVLLDGRQRRASTLLFDDLAVGDWVIVAAGTVVRRLTAAEASELTDEIQKAIGEPT